ncbi:hypothetical protein BpHYR1_006711 [Brachionus plicatilis]|uniref:Uncharacterized protein n=1 Tax=Brachionus plicatilis TaxID=10195 RepID=A0A3M7RRV9_BRAPC|nr:hypothetical protein BpHYR1_006711 [Brachionus plicatilis]
MVIFGPVCHGLKRVDCISIFINQKNYDQISEEEEYEKTKFFSNEFVLMITIKLSNLISNLRTLEKKNRWLKLPQQNII